ncbi:MAG TPA: DnaJ domain-containing protein [Acidimicrobiales bacterium]|nr:DnaJ domain-containing protein [Acidimicrobiales bacterium]
MDLDEARTVLGIDAGTEWQEVRAAYRRLLRRHHPDVAADATGAGSTTARIVAAYGTLRAAHGAHTARTPHAAVASSEGRGAPHQGDGGTVDEGDTLVLPAPADEAFLALLDAVQDVGEATYVDADAGLLETIVGSGAGACSLVVSLQGRANGTTEAFVTVEPLGQGPPPPLAPLLAELARRARGRL